MPVPLIDYTVTCNTTQGPVEVSLTTAQGPDAAGRRARMGLVAHRTYGDLDQITVDSVVVTDDPTDPAELHLHAAGDAVIAAISHLHQLEGHPTLVRFSDARTVQYLALVTTFGDIVETLAGAAHGSSSPADLVADLLGDEHPTRAAVRAVRAVRADLARQQG